MGGLGLVYLGFMCLPTNSFYEFGHFAPPLLLWGRGRGGEGGRRKGAIKGVARVEFNQYFTLREDQGKNYVLF